MDNQTGEGTKPEEKFPKGRFSRFRDWLAETRLGKTKAGQKFVYGFLEKKYHESDSGSFIEDEMESGTSASSESEGSAASDNLGDKKAAAAASEPPVAQVTPANSAGFDATVEAARPTPLADGIAVTEPAPLLAEASPTPAATPAAPNKNPLTPKTVRTPLYPEEIAKLEQNAIQTFAQTLRDTGRLKSEPKSAFGHAMNRLGIKLATKMGNFPPPNAISRMMDGLKIAVLAKMRADSPELLDVAYHEISKMPEFEASLSLMLEKAVLASGRVKSGVKLETVINNLEHALHGETFTSRMGRRTFTAIKRFADRHPVLARPFAWRHEKQSDFDSTHDPMEAAFEARPPKNSHLETIEGETQTYHAINLDELDIDLSKGEFKAKTFLERIADTRAKLLEMDYLFNKTCRDILQHNALGELSSLLDTHPEIHIQSLIRVALLDDNEAKHLSIVEKHFKPETLELIRSARGALEADGSLFHLDTTFRLRSGMSRNYDSICQAYLTANPVQGPEHIRAANETGEALFDKRRLAMEADAEIVVARQPTRAPLAEPPATHSTESVPAAAEPAATAAEAAAESTTAKVESTLAAEKSWLARVGETVKANKGKTAVATLAAAGLSYAAYEALREKTPTNDVAIGK